MADANIERKFGIERNTGPPQRQLRIHGNALHATDSQTG